MSRWKAALIHLATSAVVGIAALSLMLLVWYPYPLFQAVGGWQFLLALLGVGTTLWPLITLMVFNQKKSRGALTFDLAAIAILQVLTLIYVLNLAYQARPVFIVFSKNSFDLITANMLSDEDIAQAKFPAYRSLPITGPIYVYTELPANIKERNALAFSAFAGKDLPQFPQYYLPYAEHQNAVAGVAQSMPELKKRNPDRSAEIDDTIRHLGRTDADLGFVPLRSKRQDQAVLVEKSDGRVLKVLRMNPW